MRCVMRSFLASPPVSMMRFGNFPLYWVNASPKSMRELVVGLICANTCSRYSGTIVLHGQAFTSLPIDLPSLSSSSKIGRNFSFGPAYCSSTYRIALFKYTSGESKSPPFPSARSAIHPARFIPNLCFVFSHSRCDFSSFNPSSFTSAIHSSSERPVFSFSSASDFCAIATPGWTPYNDSLFAVFVPGMGTSTRRFYSGNNPNSVLRPFEIPDALQHRANNQRQRHRRVIENFREAPAFFWRHEFPPRDRFGVRAAAQPAPMDRFRANPHAVVVALQRKFFVTAPRQEFRVHAELLRPVPRHAAAHGQNPHALGGQHGVRKLFEIFEGIEAQQRPLVP